MIRRHELSDAEWESVRPVFDRMLRAAQSRADAVGDIDWLVSVDRAIRTWLRRRGISHTIPERTDQARNRLNHGSCGARPPAFDRDTHKRRNVAERCLNKLKQ